MSSAAVPTLPVLLRRAAARDPDRIAVRDDEAAHTYADLISDVDRLADRLTRAGCEPGTRVASLIPRSVDAIVTQAAILSAGGVYVPVDPDYPDPVIEQMLDGCAVALVVDQHGELRTRPADLPSDDSGAYIIHTSGSSGRPKGVLVSHRAIALSTMARWRHYSTPVRGFLVVSPMTFDSSMAGVWWTLTQGGTLHLAPTDPAGLVAALRHALTHPDTGLSHTLLTPTLYGQVLDGITEADTAISHVIVAGEPCPPALVREHHRLLPGVELVNEYGPTEAAVWCTSAVLRPGEDVLIGTPIPGVEAIVDDGELCIAGGQLAQGYVGDPELTAERFVPHPHRPGERMYRTGDRVRRRTGGFELLGRTDEQVKIRGHRVDLAGVRTQLSNHPDVADVAVAVRERGQGGTVLTAYVVPAADGDKAVRSAWTDVVDQIAANAEHRGGDFDTSGWLSSYTGAPLSTQDMTEWVDQTVALLTEHDPSTVLDLGCGTGLPLLRIAGRCRRYVALDPSRQTLDGLRQAVDRAGLDHVELRHGEASDVASFAGAGFDLVVCNSVSQYFPGADYLLRTVTGALDACRPDGRVVIGDVRDLSLLEAFHTSVVLARAADDTPASELSARIARRIAEETQLLVDPRWFSSTAPHVELRPRAGRRHNEMNDFRYNAVLHPGDAVELVDVDEWTALDELPSTLRAGRRVVGVRAVANARTAGACAVAAALRAGTGATAAELRSFARVAEAAATHPDALLALAAEHGYRCQLSRAAARPDGSFDAAFVPAEQGHARARFDTASVAVDRGHAPARPEPSALTNNPARQQRAAATLLPRLREHAARSLPAAHRPGAYVVLAELPLTRHGKVDLAALPAPRTERPAVSTAYQPPHTPTQRAVATVWAELLGIDRVGLDDHFTELGGDSLLAASCALALGERLGVTLPAGALFRAPTVNDLAALIERTAPPDTSVVPPEADDGDLPLTGAQTAFWYLDHYRRPGSARHPDFALPVHYRITGRLDIDALRAAVDRLVERHPALRTRVRLAADEGHQQILGAERGILRHRWIRAGDADAALREAAKHDAEHPLDPDEGRVFTAELASTSDDDHLFVMRVHHMVADGWSLDILERELGQLYRAEAAELTAPPDYAEHVRQVDQTYFADLDWRDTAPHRAALRFWTGQTADADPIQLTDSPATAPDASTRLRTLLLPASETTALVESARRNRGTLFSAVLSVLARLVAADTADHDVRLMTLAAARDAPGLDRMVGLLLNPLLLRLAATPDATFADGVRDAGATVRAALAHGQAPVLALCEEVPNLLTLMTESQFVAVESLPPVRGLDLPGCVVRRSDPFDEEFLGTRFALPVDLLLAARPEDGATRIAALYDPATFDDGYVRRLLDRLRQALTLGASEPETPLTVAADPGPIAARHTREEHR
jgi:amino acid adenylation domain-containing protein